MPKTLADMTPEDREACIGIWVDFLAGNAEKGVKEQGIFAYWQWVTEEAIISIPGLADTRKWAKPENVTPRFDLPRAWNPDGTPPPGEWQTAKMKIIPNENAKYDPDRGVITGDAVADPDHEPRDSHDIRRWISDWEKMQ